MIQIYPPETSSTSTTLPCGCVHTMTVTASVPLAFHLDIASCFAHKNAEKMVGLLDEMLSPFACDTSAKNCLTHHRLIPCPHGVWRNMKVEAKS